MSAIETIFYIRAILINIYKRYETVFNFLFRFLVGMSLFGIINKIGMQREELEFVGAYFTGTKLILVSFVFALLPSTASFALMAVSIFVQLSSHLELSIFVFLGLICLILFYIRMAPKECWLIVFTVLGFYYNVPYIAPVFAGMYFSLTAAIPIIIGVFLWDYAPRVMDLMALESAGLDFMKLPSTVGPVIEGLLNGLTANYSWVFVAFVFSMTILIVYVVSHLSMDYAKIYAILFGSLLCMIGLFLVSTIADLSMGGASIFIYSALSVALMFIIHFFDLALDYKRAQRVEFSDDDNYYYVKVIPKLIVTEARQRKRVKPAKNIKNAEYFSDEYDYGDKGERSAERKRVSSDTETRRAVTGRRMSDTETRRAVTGRRMPDTETRSHYARGGRGEAGVDYADDDISGTRVRVSERTRDAGRETSRRGTYDDE
ncbi:MAG: hypothetical protein LBS21_01970 [Clostridiales bacterium]|jgi:hypothetical protein|nr:hypothetical protein [Clostridiales bacterium]